MKNNTSLFRKVTYLVAMAGLLIPLYLLSAPSFVNPGGEGRSPGGLLTRMRDDHGLSQANLGEIDPASESMKLATLGMRGVAANLLWERANEYKKREEWDNLRATLNQIAKLQPNFISVWTFQAWNLSYNVSVEFDNYEHRYHWVKKGIEFLMQGIRYNHNEPRLLWDLGWFFGHKFGRSDEYVQFRRKYGTDEDFHESLDRQINVDDAKDWQNKPDNWLTAHQWFSAAQDVVDLNEVPIRGKNPLVFHSDSAKALIRYADAIENEGKFGEVARLAWERAHNRWVKYGDREIPTSYGYKIRLNEGESWLRRVGELGKQMEDLAPGVRENLEASRLASLTEKENEIRAADRADLDAVDYELALEIDEKLKIDADDIIAEIKDPAKRREAKLLSGRIVQAGAYATTIRRYRDVVNFNYWQTRCEVEQQDRAILAREYLWNANDKYEEADLYGALSDYEESWKRWASIHNEYEVLAEDVTAEDLVDHIKRYRRLLSQLDRDFPPPNFPMLRLVANYADEFGYSTDEKQALLAEANAMAAAGTGLDGSAEDAAEESTRGEQPDDSAESSDEQPADSTKENAGSAGEDPVDDSAVGADTAESGDGEEGTPADSATEQESGDGGASDSVATLAAAEALYLDADMAGASEKFAEGFKNVELSADTSVDEQETLIKQIRQYRILLGQLDQPFPPNEFPLGDFVKEHAEDFGYTQEQAADLFQ